MIHSTIPSYKGLKSVDLDNLGTNFCFISYLIQLSHDLKKLCVCRHFFKEDCFFKEKMDDDKENKILSTCLLLYIKWDINDYKLQYILDSRHPKIGFRIPSLLLSH